MGLHLFCILDSRHSRVTRQWWIFTSFTKLFFASFSTTWHVKKATRNNIPSLQLYSYHAKFPYFTASKKYAFDLILVLIVSLEEKIFWIEQKDKRLAFFISSVIWNLEHGYTDRPPEIYWKCWLMTFQIFCPSSLQT